MHTLTPTLSLLHSHSFTLPPSLASPFSWEACSMNWVGGKRARLKRALKTRKTTTGTYPASIPPSTDSSSSSSSSSSSRHSIQHHGSHSSQSQNQSRDVELLQLLNQQRRRARNGSHSTHATRRMDMNDFRDTGRREKVSYITMSSDDDDHDEARFAMPSTRRSRSGNALHHTARVGGADRAFSDATSVFYNSTSSSALPRTSRPSHNPESFHSAPSHLLMSTLTSAEEPTSSFQSLQQHFEQQQPPSHYSSHHQHQHQHRQHQQQQHQLLPAGQQQLLPSEQDDPVTPAPTMTETETLNDARASPKPGNSDPAAGTKHMRKKNSSAKKSPTDERKAQREVEQQQQQQLLDFFGNAVLPELKESTAIVAVNEQSPPPTTVEATASGETVTASSRLEAVSDSPCPSDCEQHASTAVTRSTTTAATHLAPRESSSRTMRAKARRRRECRRCERLERTIEELHSDLAYLGMLLRCHTSFNEAGVAPYRHDRRRHRKKRSSLRR